MIYYHLATDKFDGYHFMVSASNIYEATRKILKLMHNDKILDFSKVRVKDIFKYVDLAPELDEPVERIDPYPPLLFAQEMVSLCLAAKTMTLDDADKILEIALYNEEQKWLKKAY